MGIGATYLPTFYFPTFQPNLSPLSAFASWRENFPPSYQIPICVLASCLEYSPHFQEMDPMQLDRRFLELCNIHLKQAGGLCLPLVSGDEVAALQPAGAGNVK